MQRIWLLTGLFILVGTLATSTPADDESSVVADRTPLTFRDSGLYTNYPFFHGKHESDTVTNMLPPERAASAESPWSFYIMQYSPSSETPSQRDQTSLLREMAANGKKVILRVKLPGGLHANLDLEDCQAALQKLFTEQVDPDWLYAITLDEENVYWDGNADTLAALYHWAKEQWPDLPVYQWWTPMEVPNVRVERGWVALPADGWVIDLYLEDRKTFERKLVRALETGKPVVHIVWSSPTWPIYDNEGVSADEWWAVRGEPNFEDQIDVCRGYDVPVAHFATQPHEEVDGERVATIRWAWHAKDPLVREHYNWLETFAYNLRFLSADTIGYRELTPATFDWAHEPESPRGVIHSVDEANRQTRTIVPTLSEIPRSPGRHVVNPTEELDEVEVTCLLPEAATALSETWGVSSRAGGAVRVPVEWQIETPLGYDQELIVEADIKVFSERGGAANMTFSTDGGETWSDATPVAESDRLQNWRVKVPVEALCTDKSLRVRIELAGRAGVDTATAAMLQQVRVTMINATLDVVAK